MAEKIIIGYADAVTGENNLIELKGSELEEFLAEQKAANDDKEKSIALANQKRQVLLDKLGITEEDLTILSGTIL